MVPVVRLLLISNSTGPDGGYLDHCADAVRGFLAGFEPVLFVPFALDDEAGYGEKARGRLGEMGLEAFWADRRSDPLTQLAGAGSVFVGGGNTFRLLARLYDTGMLEAIRDRVRAGLPYVGTSAGSNVACPTIKTTNDMPIVEPPSFSAMGLVPFQINPHYVDRDPDSSHQGETREQRITEYLEANDTLVVALREGAVLHIHDGGVRLEGAPARIYRRGMNVVERPPGVPLDGLLRP